jgi:SsrA-binding protein
MAVLAFNKRANYDYEILEKYEAGLVLLGHEVKSVKTGHISLKGSFVTIKNIKGKKLPELYLVNAHIPLYKYAGTVKDYDPYRSRKLLLKKNEIKHLIGKKQEQGLTLVPIKIYTKREFVKLEFGIGRGKKKYDKREAIKKRDVDRKIRTLTKTIIRK